VQHQPQEEHVTTTYQITPIPFYISTIEGRLHPVAELYQKYKLNYILHKSEKKYVRLTADMSG